MFLEKSFKNLYPPRIHGLYLNIVLGKGSNNIYKDVYQKLINMMMQNYEWFRNADLSEYRGKWVVIVNKKIVASGRNVKSILDKARKLYPNEEPFLAKVPSKVAQII